MPAWPADKSHTRAGPVGAAGAVDAQNAPTAPWKTLLVFHELPQGFPHPITHDKPRKSPESYWETRIDPYSRMTAIDMNTAEHVWMKPMGDGDRIRNLPSLRDLDLPPLGGDSTRAGPLLTKTLLIYALTTRGTTDRPRLIALDKVTGDELASVDLPGGAIGVPMTYMVDARQYIAVTVGGSRMPELMALTLP